MYKVLDFDWEHTLEVALLESYNEDRAKAYICSPCRAETVKHILKNMKMAKLYMYYCYMYMDVLPKATHACLPLLLNDGREDERNFALEIGRLFLETTDVIYVCGDRVSEGMLQEISFAIGKEIPIVIFNSDLYCEITKLVSYKNITLNARHPLLGTSHENYY
ncbi:MAG: hypothetical protein LBS29_04760 [Endomicrobium sp.]|jgi:hypothetical protein|nr:hypothetical protein [Endomicrobium sp.]